MLVPCPRCAATLTGGSTCPACGLELTGPQAARLWLVDQRIAEVDGRLAVLRQERQTLWAEHVTLVGALGNGAPVSARAYPTTASPSPVQAPPLSPSWSAAQRPVWTPPPARPRQEWTPRRVQNLLLTIGALLLVIAGAIFTAVSWQHLGAVVRGTILLSLTGAAGLGCRTLARRGLTATAEAISAVCLGLGMFDCYAFHALVIPGTSDVRFWAAATALLGAAAAGLGRLTKVRLPWIAAALLCLLPLLILCAADVSQADRAVLFSLDALLGAGALAGLRLADGSGQTVEDLRSCWLVGAALLWALGFMMSATHVLYGLAGQPLGLILLATALTTAAAALAAWAEGAQLLPNGRPALPVLSGGSALSLVCGLALPFEAHLNITRWALVIITAGLLVLLGSALLPADWRMGPAVTATAAVALAGSSELPSVLSTLSGQLHWVDRPWSIGTAVLGRGSTLAVAQQWAGLTNVLALAACAAVAIVAGLLLDHRVRGALVAFPLVLVAAVVAVPQLNGSYAVGLTVEVTLVPVLAIATLLLGRRWAVAAQAGTAAAIVVSALAVSWSLAVPSATAAVAGGLTLLLAAAATARVPYQPVWAGAAVLTAGVCAAAVAHLGGATVPALGPAVAVVPVAVTATLAVLDRWRRPTGLLVDAVEAAAACVGVGALLRAASDGGWGSWTLLAVAGAGLLSTTRGPRRQGLPISVAGGMAAVTILPFAQHLPPGAQVACCLGLTAFSVGTACLRARTVPGRPVAAVLATAALVQAAAAIGAAGDDPALLTAALSLLCLTFGAVAALPDLQLRNAGLHLGWRATATGLSAVALLGTAAAGCWQRDLGAPVTGLVVALTAAVLATGASQLKDRQPDATVVELIAAVAVLPALRACADRPVLGGWVLAVAGLTVLVSATRPDRRTWWPAGALLISAATWVWLAVAGVNAPEPYADPIAVAALYLGFARRRQLPTTASLTAYGPGLSGLLLPSLAFALAGSGVLRPLLLAALSTAVVIVGAQHRLRAPLLLGSATLVLTALRLLAPYEQLVPRWLEVGTAGALLLTLGATYEQRRRDLGTLRARYDALL